MLVRAIVRNTLSLCFVVPHYGDGYDWLLLVHFGLGGVALAAAGAKCGESLVYGSVDLL